MLAIGWLILAHAQRRQQYYTSSARHLYLSCAAYTLLSMATKRAAKTHYLQRSYAQLARRAEGEKRRKRENKRTALSTTLYQRSLIWQEGGVISIAACGLARRLFSRLLFWPHHLSAGVAWQLSQPKPGNRRPSWLAHQPLIHPSISPSS